MKILALMTFDIFKYSLGATFEKMGHEVHYLGEFDDAKLDKTILEFRPDMVVDMGWDVWQQDKHYNGELSSIHDVIKKHNVFHLYFAEEDWLHFDRWTKKYCEIMRPNFVLTRSPLTIRHYEEMGIPATYFDVGNNPDFHKPSPHNPKYACDVAVVANGNFTIGELRYKSINDLVIPLLEEDIDLKLWGRDWERLDWCYLNKKVPEKMLQGKVPFTETPAVYNSAKICISIQTCKDQLSNRTFDILSSGGFLLTSNTKAVREKLRPGVDCIVSSSREETVELVKYYLNHNEEREKIANEGFKTGVERFSYQKSLLTVWPEIEYELSNFQANRGQNSTPINLLINNDNDWTHFNTAALNSDNSIIWFNEGEDNAFIQQKVQLTPLKNYLFSARFAKEGSGSGAPVNIIIYYYNTNHEIIEMGLYASLFETDFHDIRENKWFDYRGITLNVPELTEYATILINKISHEGSVPVLVKDWELREITL